MSICKKGTKARGRALFGGVQTQEDKQNPFGREKSSRTAMQQDCGPLFKDVEMEDVT